MVGTASTLDRLGCSFMASRIVDIQITPGRVVYVVEHLSTDSYRRSVARVTTSRLMGLEGIKDLKAGKWRGGGPIVRDDWDFDYPGAPDGFCFTAIPYTFETVS